MEISSSPTRLGMTKWRFSSKFFTLSLLCCRFVKSLSQSRVQEVVTLGEMEASEWPSYDDKITLNEDQVQANITQMNKTTCSNEYCLSDEEYFSLIEDYIFPTPYEWILISMHITVFVVGLIGNSLVCVSVYRNHSMRTVTNYFIVNLALADFLVILICLPTTVLWDVTETWFFGSVMCKLVLYLQSVSVSVSVLTLTFISVDRWYAICYPLRFKSTAARAKKAILFIWLVSFLIVLPDAVVLNTRPSPNLKIETYYLMDCTYTWSDEDMRVYQLFIVLFLYVAPFVFMLVAYCQIVRVLWDKNIPGASETTQRLSFKNSTVKQAGRGAAVRFNMPNAACEGQIRSRRKAAKMIIFVVVIFALCYLPVHLINTLRYTMGVPQTHGTTVASLLSHWLCYANSAINPIIYNFMNGKFRREFRNAFCILCSGDRNSHRNSTFASSDKTSHRKSTFTVSCIKGN